jgi:hypothetical protein
MSKLIKTFLKIPAVTLLYLFIATAIISVFALRHNNQTMVDLRNDVYAADKNNGDVNTALNNLRRYVYGHMNTDLSSGNNNIKPPVQLKYTYQRLYDIQTNKVQSANQQLYTDAELYCQSINNAYFGTTRVPCVQNYVVNHGLAAANITIPAGLYEFDFAGPAWSPDLAGWGLIFTLLLFVAFIIRFAYSKLQ